MTTAPRPATLALEPETAARDLARLLLTVFEFVRQIVEHQAVRRMDTGDLTDDQIERLGTALWNLEQAMEDLCRAFGLQPEELQLDLGPLGRLVDRQPGGHGG